MKDICLFLRNSLVRCLSEEELDEGVELLGKKSKGVFIARYAVEKLNPQDTASRGFTQFPGRHHWFLR